MDWFDMGKHAVYVWGAYGVGCGYMIALCVAGWHKHRVLKRTIKAMWTRVDAAREES